MSENVKHTPSTKSALSSKAMQLSTMLQIIHNGFEYTFESWDGDTKNNYLWVCSDLAKEIERLAEEL